MRWKFLDPSDTADVTLRELACEAIDRWWSQFEARSAAIDEHFSDGLEFDLPAFMEEHLKAISPDLWWEYGPAVDKPGHRLVITPEMNRTLRPLMETLLSRAPELDRWEFHAHRLPDIDIAGLRATVS